MSSNIPFQTIDWTHVPKEEFKGETGVAYWQTTQFEGLRIRIVEYSKGYLDRVFHRMTNYRRETCERGD